MPSDDLHWFLTLAELEHVGAAAVRLGLSQPTLSRMLARLERRLGARLFDRHGKRLSLNDFGHVYYEHARRAQAELDAAARELADLANPARGVVRLTFLHSFGARLVPELIAGFRRGSGAITFNLSQDAAEVVTGRVRDGAADLGIVSPKPAVPGLGWRELLGQRLALAVPADHRLAGRRQVRLAEAADSDFIAMQTGYGMRTILEDLCAAADFRPRIVMESSDLVTVGGLVGAGLGVALLPIEDAVSRGLGPQPGPVLVPLTDPGATRAVGLIWSANVVPSDAVRVFRDFTVEWAARAT
ncbi:LysR family transcriptional regulator [Nocardia sp. NEAU-G5]|uniref:LysR family transcriptional regulator n=1 Tax=Nocardia albiluteola TaxID=2842303 RepID=A0ABS6AYJ7_9NOCA|nr:LysR family transcriptional regulator [Nocardia albiluteola]MBU3062948.1 LysR family transcriptional regulator [Nocardia albiluteola]